MDYVLSVKRDPKARGICSASFDSAAFKPTVNNRPLGLVPAGDLPQQRELLSDYELLRRTSAIGAPPPKVVTAMLNLLNSTIAPGSAT